MPVAKKIRLLLPLLFFLAVLILLWRGLSLHPNQIPSPLIGKAAPNFTLPRLLPPPTFTSKKDFLGHVTLVNVWATWCEACAEEHALLLQIAHQPEIFLYGLNYKDNPALAKKWLAQWGNPYRIVAVDQTGDVAIDWGVYGTPETFVLDKKGILRYKQIGPITAEIWATTLQPLIKQLQQEPT